MDDSSSFFRTPGSQTTPATATATGSRHVAVAVGSVAAVGGIGILIAASGIIDDRIIAAVTALTALVISGFVAVRRIEAAKTRLVRQRTLLAEAFDGSAGRLIVDAQDRTVQVNTAFTRIIEDSAGNPAAALEREFAGDVETLASFRRLRDGARAGIPGSLELPVSRVGGEGSWRQLYARPMTGWPGHIHWRVEDITSQREMEHAIRDEQAKLVDFMDHAPVGFFSVDEEGRFLFVNATLAKWLGSAPSDLVNGKRRLHEVLADPPRGEQPYDLFPGGGGEQRGELFMRGLQGRRFQASVAQSIVRGEDGKCVRTRSVVRDLTPEREWQEALRLSEQRFQRFFEDAPIGIALLDASGNLAECNRAFLTMIGSGLSSVLGRPIGDLMQESSRADIVARLTEVQEGLDMTQPLEVRLFGNREMVAQLYARRLGGEGGGGLILHFIDMTDQKNLEIQFAQSQKMQAVGQLAGGVAHDFNNLLTAMIGFCDLLLLRHKPGDQSFSDIMQIKQNANRAANLVRQLLAFSRQQTLQPRILDITDVLAELSNLLRRLIGENIELKMIHGRSLGLVRVDQGQLEQVIINLAVNARDAMPTGGRLTILTSNLAATSPIRREHEEMPAGDYVLIEVIDTGIGIPRENLARIFEPFFSTKEVGSGTGLGLSTVYGIVRQTGGFIFVDSSPGEGAKFSIYLPRHQELASSEAAASGEPRDRQASDLTGVGTILLVEDEDAVRVFSARALRNKGYNVLEAKSGEQALGLLNSDGHRVDLLISDVVMPQMDGPTLIRNVRESHPDLKVIFISGYAEDRFRQHLDDGQTIEFLPKPFSLKQLASKVKDVMRSEG